MDSSPYEMCVGNFICDKFVNAFDNIAPAEILTIIYEYTVLLSYCTCYRCTHGCKSCDYCTTGTRRTIFDCKLDEGRVLMCDYRVWNNYFVRRIKIGYNESNGSYIVAYTDNKSYANVADTPRDITIKVYGTFAKFNKNISGLILLNHNVNCISYMFSRPSVHSLTTALDNSYFKSM